MFKVSSIISTANENTKLKQYISILERQQLKKHSVVVEEEEEEKAKEIIKITKSDEPICEPEEASTDNLVEEPEVSS